MELNRLPSIRLSGSEAFRNGSEVLNLNVLGFWQWSASDLVSNATRGRLAEYIVATALRIDVNSVRDEWAAFDLLTPEGVRVEVKSAAFVQSWHQAALSRITFGVPKTRTWNPDTNQLETVPCRKADVYVFALLAHQTKQSINPLDLSQWMFYVLPTSVLDARTRSQHSITLPSLERLCTARTYGQLDAAVIEAATANKNTGRSGETI